jgi:hypothetical protein
MELICISCETKFRIAEDKFQQYERVISCPGCGFTQQIPQEIEDIKSLQVIKIKREGTFKKPFRVTARWSTVSGAVGKDTPDRSHGIVDVDKNQKTPVPREEIEVTSSPSVETKTPSGSHRVVQPKTPSGSHRIAEVRSPSGSHRIVQQSENRISDQDLTQPQQAPETPPPVKKTGEFSKVVWKVKSPSGLILHFKIINILQNWSQSIENISKYHISKDEEDWRNLDEFIKFIKQTGSGTAAFSRAKIDEAYEIVKNHAQESASLEAEALGSGTMPEIEMTVPEQVPIEKKETKKVVRQTSDFIFKIEESGKGMGLGKLLLWLFIGMMVGAGILTVVFYYFFFDKS